MNEESLSLIRLERRFGPHFVLYPVFEQRVRQFCERYLLTETNLDKLAEEMLTRWIFQPNDTGYFLLQHQNGEVVGHVACWIASLWDKRYVFCYQFEFDQTCYRPAVAECFRQWIAWVKTSGLNTLEFQTPHDSRLFIRYLRRFGIESIKTRSVIRARID